MTPVSDPSPAPPPEQAPATTPAPAPVAPPQAAAKSDPLREFILRQTQAGIALGLQQTQQALNMTQQLLKQVFNPRR
jgi:hypothetical protein